MGVSKLVEELETLLISEKYLTKETATKWLHEGLRFGRDRLKAASMDVLIKNFEEITTLEESKKEGEEPPKVEYRVSTLPASEFLQMIQSDDLKVGEESVVVRAIEGYLKLREPLKPLLEEEDPAFDPKLVA